MSNNKQQKKIAKELSKVIKKMQGIQKSIATDEQPVAMHEVDALTDLGQRYADIVKRLEVGKT